MKRSRIGPKTYEEALSRRIASQERRRAKATGKPRPERQSPARSGKARKSTPSQHRRKPLRAGKKVKAWESERRKLKKRFERGGITTCELRYEGCANDDYLGFAHAAKRRKLGPDDLGHVILCCNFCHDQIEVLEPEKMKQIVDGTILARPVQP